MNPVASTHPLRLVPMWIGLLILVGVATATGKNIVLDGVVVDAGGPYSVDGTHLLLDGPQGPILAVLQDLSRELRSESANRQRLVARLARQVRSADGLPVMEVIERCSANGSDPMDARTPASFGNWLGHGGSLYPSLDPEPLPVRHTVTGGSDRDGDGVPDDQDFFPDDPTEFIDSDGDGIGNNADPDDDNDEVPDLYEIANDLNPLVRDALTDRDGDGMNNRGEWIAGTRANDPASVLRLMPLQYDREKGVEIAWPSVVGRTYDVLFSNAVDDPKPGVATQVTATGPSTSIQLPAPEPPADGFVRIQVIQP